MDKEFWHQRWRTGQIGFHSPKPHWALDHYWERLKLPDDEPVLVPLCGKSLDLHWLRERGHRVEGVELDGSAVNAFFDEWQASGQLKTPPQSGESWSEADGIRLWNQDFFDFRLQTPPRAFYDRAALIALPPSLRPSYMAHLRRCLARAAKGLLITLEYDQNHKSGPPFSVLHEEIASFPGFSVELLERRDVLAESPGFQASGITTLHEAVYRLNAVP